MPVSSLAACDSRLWHPHMCLSCSLLLSQLSRTHSAFAFAGTAHLPPSARGSTDLASSTLPLQSLSCVNSSLHVSTQHCRYTKSSNIACSAVQVRVLTVLRQTVLTHSHPLQGPMFCQRCAPVLWVSVCHHSSLEGSPLGSASGQKEYTCRSAMGMETCNRQVLFCPC